MVISSDHEDAASRVLRARMMLVANEEIEVQAVFEAGPYEGYSPVRIRRGDARGGATIRFPRCVGAGATILGFSVDGKQLPVEPFRVDEKETPVIVLRGDDDEPMVHPAAMMRRMLDAVDVYRAEAQEATDFQMKVAVLGAALLLATPDLDRRRLGELIDLALGVFGLLEKVVRPVLPEPFEADPEDEET